MLIATGKKEKLSASKGSLIEVSSHYKGYSTGQAWYCAILEEDLGKSKKKMLRVRYLDPLLKQDYSPKLMQTIEQRLIRPVPPLVLLLDVDFEEGDIIDAVYNGRWCIGWVIKVLGNGDYLVYLKSEPGAMEFERKDMRLHMVWEDDKWFRCEKKHLIEPNYSSGTYVEARIEVDDNMGDVWSLAKVIKDNEDGTLLVKLKNLCNDKSKYTKISLPYSKIRPEQPEYGYRIYKFMEKVDVYIKTRWCPGVVSKVLSGDKYVVVLEPNKESKEFSYRELQPSLEWKDGLWVREEKAPEETTIGEIVNKRKRGRACKFVSTEPKQKSGVAATVSKATTIELANMTDDDRPLASWIHGEKTSSGLAGLRAGQSVSRSPEPMLNSVVEKHVDVERTPPTRESTMALPFIKKSPIWKVLESMEVFEAVPQHPHFTPLLESVEESREGEAIGQMVMYTGLLEKLNNLQVDEPISSINRIDECLLKLEKHGFNVTEHRSRIAKLLSIKEAQAKALEESKAAEEKISENDRKRRKTEEDIVELKIELQRREAMLKEAKVRLDKEIAQKVRIDKEIAQMQSNAAVLDQKVKNVDQELRAIVAAPW